MDSQGVKVATYGQSSCHLWFDFLHWDCQSISTCHWNFPWGHLPFSYLYKFWALICILRTSCWACKDSAGFCIHLSYNKIDFGVLLCWCSPSIFWGDVISIVVLYILHVCWIMLVIILLLVWINICKLSCMVFGLEKYSRKRSTRRFLVKSLAFSSIV